VLDEVIAISLTTDVVCVWCGVLQKIRRRWFSASGNITAERSVLTAGREVGRYLAT
jgi:hypothetical protein